FPAALKHLELARTFDPRDEASSGRLVHLIESNSSISAWQKNSYRPAEPPPTLPEEVRQRFAEALKWVDEGLWARAAAALERLAAVPEVARTGAADRNLGLCRLWLGDHAAAVGPLRRWIARAGTSPVTQPDAVDLEALCQQIAEPRPDDQVELVQWT